MTQIIIDNNDLVVKRTTGSIEPCAFHVKIDSESGRLNIDTIINNIKKAKSICREESKYNKKEYGRDYGDVISIGFNEINNTNLNNILHELTDRDTLVDLISIHGTFENTITDANAKKIHDINTLIVSNENILKPIANIPLDIVKLNINGKNINTNAIGKLRPNHLELGLDEDSNITFGNENIPYTVFDLEIKGVISGFPKIENGHISRIKCQGTGCKNMIGSMDKKIFNDKISQIDIIDPSRNNLLDSMEKLADAQRIILRDIFDLRGIPITKYNDVIFSDINIGEDLLESDTDREETIARLDHAADNVRTMLLNCVSEKSKLNCNKFYNLVNTDYFDLIDDAKSRELTDEELLFLYNRAMPNLIDIIEEKSKGITDQKNKHYIDKLVDVLKRKNTVKIEGNFEILL